MAKKDTSFIFFKDWAVLIDSLNTEDRLYFWDLFSKCDTQIVCEKDTVKPVWNFIVSQLNKMQENYQSNIVERNQTNGKLGGRPSKDKEENPNNPMGLKKPKKPKLTQKTLNRIESNRIEDKLIEEKEETHPFISWIKSNCKSVSKMTKFLTDAEAERLVNEFDKNLLVEICQAMENHKELNNKYSSTNLTIRAWINMRKSNPIKNQSTINQGRDGLLLN